MGFSAFPPRPIQADYLRAVDMWIQRADAAILHESPPWAALLSGTSADAAVRALNLPLVQGYKSRGLDVVFTIDLTNGLDRRSEDPTLVAMGRSLASRRSAGVPRVRARRRQRAPALAPRPRRGDEPDPGRGAARGLRRRGRVGERCRGRPAAAGFTAPLYVSVQVEVAWGRPSGAFVGIDADRQDFPFATALGLSSYPFLGGFAEPEQVPSDYYARVNAVRLPLLVVEGGWTSAAAFGSTPERQARWIRRQFELATQTQARHVFQLLFTDLDVAAYGQLGSASLSPFATIGLVSTELAPKPALAEWDAAFARPRR